MTSAINIKRILVSLGMLVFVGAIVWGATGAFFSDSETSTGNTFSAGDIDLKIDNTSYVTNATGTLVASPNNSWALSDLTNQLFFSFTDVKPGDIGEDTISIHPGSNDAWACMAAKLTSTPDNGITEPEADENDVTDGPTGGELQNFLNFTFWRDDGDNVFETGETVIPALTGPASQIFTGDFLPIADSSASTTPLAGNSTNYVGKAWCFGTLTANGTTQDGNGSSTPLTRGTTGFTCSGAGNNNIAQTDGIVVDVGFYAEQARNNGNFLCSSVPDLGTTTATTTEPVEVNVTTEQLNGWSWYDDTNDVINNALGTFVAGPGNPPAGDGSASTTLASALSRVFLQNNSYGNIPLSTLTQLAFTEWSDGGVGGANEAPFVRFNVDFTTGSSTYQNSLVYVPSLNGAIVKNSWQTWNMVQAGSLWLYSGAFWPAGGSETGTTPGSTAKTWSSILADYPNIRTWNTGPQIGIRFGEPGPAGYTGNADSFVIATGGPATTYDFGN